ncbi:MULTISPECIES: YfgG family protein [unclassified Brenneria]|uniref:YfgG family protein n=1 Tax=unclassified Brenneria TaxID=2634434 RepID=UPI001552E076|nr:MULTISPECIES: YfgG family protein [unclassified Brenneria]MBJ7224002.1 DUF2633 family protein [Brenneria sp. L3-3C-1]MEE3645247.1 YfgG family protein [Brenneria sp. L3_3C_1]MEE3652969.1 YfgG family protein [Brenneria sp. HEZEL_4_2_4]NPD02923.1 DUF2633 family protein [Brenneria sp. hezel4-2-4]
MSTLTHKRRISMRPRRSSSRIARAVLLISFIILLGRFAYSTISAFAHHQDKQQQRIEQPLASSDVLINKKE